MASNTNIGASQQGPGMDIGASQTAVAVAVESIFEYSDALVSISYPA